MHHGNDSYTINANIKRDHMPEMIHFKATVNDVVHKIYS